MEMTKEQKTLLFQIKEELRALIRDVRIAPRHPVLSLLPVLNEVQNKDRLKSIALKAEKFKAMHKKRATNDTDG